MKEHFWKCARCGVQVATFFNDPCTPSGSTLFEGRPGYGSKFDALGQPTTLCIVICDGCLMEISSEGGVQESVLVERPRHFKTWADIEMDGAGTQ